MVLASTSCTIPLPLAYTEASSPFRALSLTIQCTKAMNDQAHALGVQTGFYGNNCWCHQEENVAFRKRGGNPAEDAALTSTLEFDGIKVDGCGPAHNISIWYEALVKTGRKIMLENCGDNNLNWYDDRLRLLHSHPIAFFAFSFLSSFYLILILRSSLNLPGVACAIIHSACMPAFLPPPI